jgi:riboflavin kinase/FMN adenylyltransferase
VILLRRLDDLPESLRRGAVTIGNFDGVHLGHAQIVRRLVEHARQLGGAAVALTFDPHPAQILRPELAPVPLCRTQRKAELLGDLGVDAVIAYPTDAAFLALEAPSFFDRVIRGCLDARVVVEGPNFFFGHNRQGNVELLDQLCRQSGVRLEVVGPVEVDGHIVSSSLIRKLLAAGKVEQGARLLTQPHRIGGPVVHGAGRGASLGFPTANIEPPGILVPGAGIYAGRALVDGSFWPAAVSIGPNPTFGEGYLKIEAHLIDYEGLLYDQRIEIDFLARLRDIVRFDSVEALVAQMTRDVAAVRDIAATYPCQGARA